MTTTTPATDDTHIITTRAEWKRVFETFVPKDDRATTLVRRIETSVLNSPCFQKEKPDVSVSNENTGSSFVRGVVDPSNMSHDLFHKRRGHGRGGSVHNKAIPQQKSGFRSDQHTFRKYENKSGLSSGGRGRHPFCNENDHGREKDKVPNLPGLTRQSLIGILNRINIQNYDTISTKLTNSLLRDLGGPEEEQWWKVSADMILQKCCHQQFYFHVFFRLLYTLVSAAHTYNGNMQHGEIDDRSATKCTIIAPALQQVREGVLEFLDSRLKGFRIDILQACAGESVVKVVKTAEDEDKYARALKNSRDFLGSYNTALHVSGSFHLEHQWFSCIDVLIREIEAWNELTPTPDTSFKLLDIILDCAGILFRETPKLCRPLFHSLYSSAFAKHPPPIAGDIRTKHMISACLSKLGRLQMDTFDKNVPATANTLMTKTRFKLCDVEILGRNLFNNNNKREIPHENRSKLCRT